MLPWRASLAAEKFDKFRDDLIGRFFHEPVPGFANDQSFQRPRRAAPPGPNFSGNVSVTMWTHIAALAEE